MSTVSSVKRVEKVLRTEVLESNPCAEYSRQRGFTVDGPVNRIRPGNG